MYLSSHQTLAIYCHIYLHIQDGRRRPRVRDGHSQLLASQRLNEFDVPGL